jgi:hypothetical protein
MALRSAWIAAALGYTLLSPGSWVEAQEQKASDYVTSVQDSMPNSIVTADPFSSINTSQQVNPALSTPLPDQLSANLQVTPNGAAVTASVAPFGFTSWQPGSGYQGWHPPVLSELRLELYGNAASQPEFGFGVSLGYNSATHSLNESDLDSASVQGFVNACVASSPSSPGASIAGIAAKVQTLLDGWVPFFQRPVDDVRKATTESALATDHDEHVAVAAGQILVATEDNFVLDALEANASDLRATVAQVRQQQEQARATHRSVAQSTAQLNKSILNLLKAYDDGAKDLNTLRQLAQTPTSDAKYAPHILAVAGQFAKSPVGDALLKTAPSATRSQLIEIAATDAAVIAARNAYSDTIGQCVEKKLAQKRVDVAFTNAGSIYLKGTFHFYPVGSGPTYKATDGTVTQPFDNALSLASITLTGTYFPSRYMRVQPIIGYSWSYASPSSTTLNQDFSAALDLGWSRGFGKPDKDGFQPTFGLGINWGLDKCITAIGCAHADIANYSGPKPKVNLTLNNAFYLFLRVSAKVQIQLTAPVKVYLLASAIDSTSASTQIVEFIPTLTASVAGWTVAQPTQNQ